MDAWYCDWLLSRRVSASEAYVWRGVALDPVSWPLLYDLLASVEPEFFKAVCGGEDGDGILPDKPGEV